MNEVAQYIVGVVVIPALVAACAALPFAVGPLRRRRALVEGGIASAVMVAFVLSFTRELDWSAIVRQVVAIPDDNAPFERWHRVGMAAIVLWLAAWAIALVVGWVLASTRRLGFPVQSARVPLVAMGATLVLAALAATFVRFPGTGLAWQLALAVAICASTAAFATSRRGTMLWSSWIVFGVLAVLSGEGGFASLAVMCGAASMASFLIAVLWWFGGRRRAGDLTADDADATTLPSMGAATVVLGTLVAVVALCGRACNTMEIAAPYWILAALLPAAHACLRFVGVRPSSRRAQAIAEVVAVGVAAGVLLGAFVVLRGWSPDASTPVDQGTRDIYGG